MVGSVWCCSPDEIGKCLAGKIGVTAYRLNKLPAKNLFFACLLPPLTMSISGGACIYGDNR